MKNIKGPGENVVMFPQVIVSFGPAAPCRHFLIIENDSDGALGKWLLLNGVPLLLTIISPQNLVTADLVIGIHSRPFLVFISITIDIDTFLI